MKGIILSGGAGTRLYPLTKVTSKQLLPVYNKPMIFYPLQKLLDAGIKDILIIVAPDHCGEYMKVLGSGREFGVKFTYEIQDKPEGIAQAYLLAEEFIGNDSSCMLLGDNLIQADLSEHIRSFVSGGRVFAFKVKDPERFGQVEFDSTGKVTRIEEKAIPAISNYAIPGIYIFDSKVASIAKQVTPSSRGELEITEVQKIYLQNGELDVRTLEGEWLDAGTFETLFQAQAFGRKLSEAVMT